MLPSKEEAVGMLEEAEGMNPGPWAAHSRVAGACARRIACRTGLDGEKAETLGLLHDIGRRFGISQLRHVYDGWRYMLQLGYDEVARVCLSHSFPVPDIRVDMAAVDITPEAYEALGRALAAMRYDDYDRLIQLCDSIAMAEGPVDREMRMTDVKRRYGAYPQEKWEKNLALKAYFEACMKASLREALPNLKIN